MSSELANDRPTGAAANNVTVDTCQAHCRCLACKIDANAQQRITGVGQSACEALRPAPEQLGRDRTDPQTADVTRHAAPLPPPHRASRGPSCLPRSFESTQQEAPLSPWPSPSPAPVALVSALRICPSVPAPPRPRARQALFGRHGGSAAFRPCVVPVGRPLPPPLFVSAAVYSLQHHPPSALRLLFTHLCAPAAPGNTLHCATRVGRPLSSALSALHCCPAVAGTPDLPRAPSALGSPLCS